MFVKKKFANKKQWNSISNIKLYLKKKKNKMEYRSNKNKPCFISNFMINNEQTKIDYFIYE